MDKERLYFYFAVMVRTILPSTMPPSYRGATIRYLYYVRSILSGKYLIMENGHFSEESIQDLAELVSFLLFCYFIYLLSSLFDLIHILAAFKSCPASFVTCSCNCMFDFSVSLSISRVLFGHMLYFSISDISNTHIIQLSSNLSILDLLRMQLCYCFRWSLCIMFRLFYFW